MAGGTSARNVGIWGYQQAQDAASKGQSLIDQAKDGALLSLGKGYGRARDDLTGNYTAAIDRLNPWYDAGKDALGVYQGSIGVGGDAAREAAVSAFREAPGYRYSVDQATDAVARKASALGALGSGNTMQAITDRAQNMADQGYKDWQAQVLGVSDRGQQAATTQAGLQGQLGSTLATLGQGQGRDEAGVFTGLAGLGLSNLWNGTNAGIGAVTNAQKQAADNVASKNSLWANGIGSAINLLSLGMGSPLAAGMMAGAGRR